MTCSVLIFEKLMNFAENKNRISYWEWIVFWIFPLESFAVPEINLYSLSIGRRKLPVLGTDRFCGW